MPERALQQRLLQQPESIGNSALKLSTKSPLDRAVHLCVPLYSVIITNRIPLSPRYKSARCDSAISVFNPSRFLANALRWLNSTAMLLNVQTPRNRDPWYISLKIRISLSPSHLSARCDNSISVTPTEVSFECPTVASNESNTARQF